jgi:hypothetical protein
MTTTKETVFRARGRSTPPTRHRKSRIAEALSGLNEGDRTQATRIGERLQ